MSKRDQRSLEVAFAEMSDQVNMLTESVHMLYQQMQLVLASKESDESNRVTKMRDSIWVCKACAARLGIYDPEEDKLRVRYKDFICYVQPGDGGTVTVPCRRCGLENKLEDTRKNAQAYSGG